MLPLFLFILLVAEGGWWERDYRLKGADGMERFSRGQLLHMLEGRH
jgi:hypothetical protein